MANISQSSRRKKRAIASWIAVFCCAITLNGVGSGTGSASGAAVAQTSSVQSSLADLDRFPLFPALSSEPYQGRMVAADSQLSPTEMERPSLSWIEDQIGNRYGSDRLIERWRAYRVLDSQGETLNYVDVIVNEPIWELLNYFERYAFISQFGSSAKSQGYNLRVFHTGDEQASLEANGATIKGIRTAILRGAYFCNFQPTSASPEDFPCNIVLDESSLRTRRPLLSQ